MINFEEELSVAKNKIADLAAEFKQVSARVDEISDKLDSGTDTILSKIQKSSVSWLIVLGYSFGVFTLGAVLF